MPFFSGGEDLLPNLEYHNGPLDGKKFLPMAIPVPEDAEYKIRVDESGKILGVWWSPEPIERV